MRLQIARCAKPSLVEVIPAIDAFVPTSEVAPIVLRKAAAWGGSFHRSRTSSRRGFVPRCDGIVPGTAAIVHRAERRRGRL